MPDQTSAIGPLTLPLANEGSGAAITDPVADGLLDFFRFWIVDGLASRLDDINAELPDPLPVANLFPYDPGDNWPRNAVPALYVWWTGQSKRQEYSMLYEARVRTFRLMYVFRDVPYPVGARLYSGVPAAVDAILCKASDRGHHPAYGYNGDALGTRLSDSLNLLGWRYDGGEPGLMLPVPGTSSRTGGPSGGNVVQVYPALVGSVTVTERVEHDTLTAADQNYDIAMGIRVNDPSDVRGPLAVMDRYLVPPAFDGDNEPEE